MTLAISTFSADGRELYGDRMVETWLEHWPQDHVLRIYTEGFSLPDRPGLEQHDLYSVSPALQAFVQASNHKLATTENRKQKRRIQKTIKWCHKVYAMAHALADDRFRHLIWLDGDTRSVDKVPAKIAQLLVGDHLMAVHWERLKHGLHFETGLVVFNRAHTQIQLLLENLTHDYDTLAIYHEEKTWDGYHFSRLYQRLALDVLDLSHGRGVFSHPMVKSCLRHDAGKRKYVEAGYDHFTAKKLPDLDNRYIFLKENQ